MKKMLLLGAALLVGFATATPAEEQVADMTFFLTSAGPGDGANLGGLAGADAHCQSLAAAVGAGSRTWRAYLSTTGGGRRQRARPHRRRSLAEPRRRGRGARHRRAALREQPHQGDRAQRAGRDDPGPGRQPEPARHPDRVVPRRHRRHERRRHHLRQLDVERRRRGQRHGRPLRPHRRRPEPQLVELGPRLARLQPGEPAGHGGQRLLLLLRHSTSPPIVAFGSAGSPTNGAGTPRRSTDRGLRAGKVGRAAASERAARRRTRPGSPDDRQGQRSGRETASRCARHGARSST